MSSNRFWVKILNVYPDELAIVKRLYLFQFLQGAGIAFFFTSAFAQFLEKHPVIELPWVMICSALLLWLTGIIYMRLEHIMDIVKFNKLIIVFMASSIIILWVANGLATQRWFLYLLLAWFNVLYFLNNLEFWGIATRIFDLRQSKRLFAVISAGDIPAKFIGYTLAVVFVPYTGTKNLLLLSAACMLISIPFFNSIIRSGKMELHHPPHKKEGPASTQKEIKKLATNIATHTYVRRIAFISLVTSCCVLLINYGFYGEVKKAYHDDVALARFIAFFYASLRIAALITKMVYTSRLTATVGVRPALFITPVIMLVLITCIVFASGMTTDQQMIFYLFGVTSIIVDVFQTSFNTPVLLTIMQPLPTHERMRAHNIVKGLMEPFASLLSGTFLLIVLNFYKRIDLVFICYALLLLGFLWILGVVLVNRQYLQILIKTIASRYFSREEFNLNDPAIINQVRSKIKVGSDLEVISILRMLNSKIDSVSEDLIAGLLVHASDQVKLETLRLIKNCNLTGMKDDMEMLLQSEVAADVREEAVRTICKIGNDDWRLTSYLGHPDEGIRKAAITGMLGNNNGSIKKMAENVLDVLLHSSKAEDKVTAISILNEVKEEYDHPAHTYLVNDPDPLIRESAIKAIGISCSHETLVALFEHITTNEKQVLGALFNAGANAIPLLKEQIKSGKLSETLKEKLIIVCGKIGGENAKHVLLEFLKTQPRHSAVIIRGLYRCKYSADMQTQKLLESIARTYLVYGVELLHMQQALSKNDYKYKVLNSSLNQEIQEIREVLLCLFACMYDREKINQVKYGLDTRHRESRANAMEIIELTVKKDIGRQFNTMFETTSIDQRCAALRSLFTERQFAKVEHILGRILSEKPIHYYSWTKACSLYISKKHTLPLDTAVYKKYIDSENNLLRETALFASSIA